MDQVNQSLYDRIGGQAGISTLLRHFYADVRQHRLIGPVFNRQIKDWPVHLARIGEFWARVTGGPSSYAGQMPAKHFGLDLHLPHFEAWLMLWDANCRCHLKPREAQELSQLAHDIGQRLRSILSGKTRREHRWPFAVSARAFEFGIGAGKDGEETNKAPTLQKLNERKDSAGTNPSGGET